MRGERGRQEEACIGHELRPVERRVNPVEAVGRSHLAGAPLFGFDGCFATPSFPIRWAPVRLSRIVNHARRSVDPGLPTRSTAHDGATVASSSPLLTLTG